MIITTVAGNLGKDAVAKSTQDGTQLCQFSLGASIGYGDRKQTIWFDVTKWGKGTDKLADMLTKGTKVTVSGELSTREYEGKTYLQIRADHLTLQGGKPSNKPDAGSSDQGNMHGGGSFGGGFDDDLDDSIPF
jgi:single-strand DNA-binding protein